MFSSYRLSPFLVVSDFPLLVANGFIFLIKRVSTAFPPETSARHGQSAFNRV